MTFNRPMFPPPLATKSRSASEQNNGSDLEPLSRTPETASDPLYVPTGLTPEDFFAARGSLRKEAEAEVERLLAFLDEIDGDADLEPTGDEADDGSDNEPSLAAFENHPEAMQGHYSRYRREQTYRDRDGSQVEWVAGDADDREDEHDGREPDNNEGGESEREDDEDNGDHEPSLGSFDRMLNQDKSYRLGVPEKGWWHFDNSDKEVDRYV